MRWNITLGSPGEFFRTLEDIMEDTLQYSVGGKKGTTVLPTLKPTGIPNVAEFYGTLRADTQYDKRRWDYVLAGLVLVAFSLGLIGAMFSLGVRGISESLSFIGIGIILLVAGIVLIIKHHIVSSIGIRIVLEGEAYQSKASATQKPENLNMSERFAIYSRARLAMKVVYDAAEPPKPVLDKAYKDLDILKQKVEKILPKFALPPIELPETIP